MTDRRQGYFNDKLELLTLDEINNFKLAQLKSIVQHAYYNASAIKKKFEADHLKPEHIIQISDLEKLSITHKNHLSQLQHDNLPFGGFLGVKPNALKRIYISPGPIYEPAARSADDDRWAQAVFAAGFRPGDTGQIAFSYHMVPAAFWFEEALLQIGCTAIPAGVGNSEMQTQIMKDLKVSGYIGTPSFLAAIAERAIALGFDLQNDLNLKVGFVAGEMLTQNLRIELEQSFNMIIRQGYGTADVGCLGYECQNANGMHIPNNCLVEIVDPDTGRQLKPGEIGEIVVTVFDPVYPLVRFGTGDLSFINEEPCQCGRHAPRLMKIIGRIDQVTKVKGMFIHPQNVLDLKAKFKAIDKIQAIVTRTGHQDLLTIHIELIKGTPSGKDLQDKIENAIPKLLRVKGSIQIEPAHTIKEAEKLIIDKRKWD